MEKSAFTLAEEYRDFRSLVELCHSIPPIYPLKDNIHANTIKTLIERYKEEYTGELFAWCVEHGKLR